MSQSWVVVILVLMTPVFGDSCQECRSVDSDPVLCEQHLQAEKEALKRLRPVIRGGSTPSERIGALQKLARTSKDHDQTPTRAVAVALAIGLTDKSVVVQEIAARLLANGQHKASAVSKLNVAVKSAGADVGKLTRRVEKKAKSLSKEEDREDPTERQQRKALKLRSELRQLRGTRTQRVDGGVIFVGVLAELGDPSSQDRCLGFYQVLLDHAPRVSGRAMTALFQFEGPKSVELLTKTLKRYAEDRTEWKQAASEDEKFRKAAEELGELLGDGVDVVIDVAGLSAVDQLAANERWGQDILGACNRLSQERGWQIPAGWREDGSLEQVEGWLRQHEDELSTTPLSK